MTLFDEQTNGYSGPTKLGESSFAFLNRSVQPKEQAVRERLELWFLRYPAANQNSLRARLRSEVDQEHDAAFFELLLHELLLRLGCRVEVEAPIPDKRTKPDFLVEDPSGLKWYLEAVTVSAMPSLVTGAQRMMASLCDWLNDRLPRRDYLLLVFYTGSPSGSPPKKPMLKFLRDKLGSCDYPTVLGASRSRGYQALPCWVYPWGACRVQFQLIPRKESAREDASVPVLCHPNLAREASLEQMVNRIRDAIMEKARKYGRLKKPFVVALNVPNWHVDSVQFMLALFGWDDLAHGFSEGPELVKLGMPRPKGVWLQGTSAKGACYTRLSAVVCCSYLTPWNLGESDLRLYNNPWAAHPYESVLNRLPLCVTHKDGRSERSGGLSLAGILAD